MIYKYSGIVFILFVLISCKTKNIISTVKTSQIDTVAINILLQQKQIENSLSFTNNEIYKLKYQKRNKEYIFYNYWFISKLNKYNVDIKKINNYYTNIIETESDDIVDTFSTKIITKAYYNWAEFNFRDIDRIDDSIILCLEKSILFNRKTHCLTIGDESYAYNMLGILYNKIGDTKKALNYYNILGNFIDKSNNNWIAANAINVSIALKETGSLDSAINLIKSVYKLPKISVFRYAELATILSEAQFAKRQFDESEKNIESAIYSLDTATSSLKIVNEKKALALKQKGIIQRQNGENLESIETLFKSLDYCEDTTNSNNRIISKIYIELGKSFDATAQYDSALKYYQIALQKVIKVDSADYFSMPTKAHLYAENTIMEALDAKAITLEKMYAQNHQQKYLETAVQCYEIISIVEKQLLQNFSYDESRLIMLKENRTRSERAINTCYKLFLLTGNNYWSQQGFQFAENSKAFVLLESIKRNMQSNSGLHNDTLYEKVQALQTRLSYSEKKLFGNSDVKNDSTHKGLLHARSKLNEQLLLANNELKLSSSNYKAFGNKIDTINAIENAKALLDDNTAIVEFFSGDSSNYIFVFTKKKEVVFLKAQPTFLQNLKNYVSFFTDKNKISNAPADYQHAAYDFYNETGLAKNISSTVSSIIIITDGSVNYVPFEALVTEEVKDVSPKSFSYLLLTKQISYGYSIATLAAQVGNTTSSSNKVACYAPVFANGEQGKQPLLYSIDELDAIKATNADGEYFLKNTATLAQFKNTIEKAGIIHIATHANADTSAGMQSSIHFFDSSLYLNEVYNLHLKANLVVLSACETNIGIINKSEGAMSLARGFYYAGARNVETSLWNVNDKSTAILFSNFYTGIKDNNYIAALRNAKLHYLQNANVASSSPYYWAGFIHIGYNKPHSYPVMFITFILIANLLLIFLLLSKIISGKY